jgi:hypothetical protein
MKLLKSILFLLIGVLLIITSSCFFPDSSFIIDLSDDKVIQFYNTVIDIYEEETDTAGRAITSKGTKKVKVDFEKTITYKARILPVVVEGVPVHANDVIISGNRAYIAYNYAGAQFKGAIQIVDISTEGAPEIITELKFSSMDINTLNISGNKLYFGGQADPDQFSFRSFIGVIDTNELTDIDLNSIADSIVGLKSYATTAIVDTGSSLYVGVGAKDGYIQVLNSSLGVTQNIDMPDIRDIQKYHNGIVAIAGTTDNVSLNGRVLMYSANDLDNPTILEIPDFESPYHKSTIEMYGNNFALLGLSEAGMKVLDIKDNEEDSEYVFQLENPVADYTDKTNTNSVTTDANYIFSANGEYGFRVLRVLDNMNGKNAAFAEVIGYFPFEGLTVGDEPYSANHIDFKSNHLFVASGVGGVNIYLLQ